VLIKARWRPAQRPDRGTRQAHPARLHDRLEPELLGERVGLGDVVDRADGDVGIAQQRHPVVGGAGTEDGGQALAQLIAVGHARLVGGEALVLRQLSEPDRLAQPREQPVVADRQGERPVLRLEGLIRRDARVAVAAAGRKLTREHPSRPQVEQRGQHGVQQRDLDVAAAAGARALDQRGLDACHGEQAADQVDEGGPDLQRRPVGLARDAHQPAHRLRQQVIAREPGRLLGRAERGDRARDQARVGGAQRLPVEPPARHQPGAEGLDQHVGALAEATGELAVARV